MDNLISPSLPVLNLSVVTLKENGITTYIVTVSLVAASERLLVSFPRSPS